MAARHALFASLLLVGAALPASAQLFPTGQCGGLLCSAIGGTQAPPSQPPRGPCGGGLLCDIAPNAMQPPVTASTPQLAPPPEPMPMAAPVGKPGKARRRHKS